MANNEKEPTIVKKSDSILPSILIDDYNRVMGKDIHHFVDGTKIHVTMVLTKEIVEAYGTIPELKMKLSKRARFLLAQDLVNNGYGTESAEQKLKQINQMSRDLDNCKLILNEHISKQREVELQKTRDKAESIRIQDQLVEYISNTAVEYKKMYKTRLSREQPDVAKTQIMELIESRLIPDIKNVFSKEIDANKLFDMMGLSKV